LEREREGEVGSNSVKANGKGKEKEMEVDNGRFEKQLSRKEKLKVSAVPLVVNTESG
jgi:hypothetical protein